MILEKHNFRSPKYVSNMSTCRKRTASCRAIRLSSSSSSRIKIFFLSRKKTFFCYKKVSCLRNNEKKTFFDQMDFVFHQILKNDPLGLLIITTFPAATSFPGAPQEFPSFSKMRAPIIIQAFYGCIRPWCAAYISGPWFLPVVLAGHWCSGFLPGAPGDRVSPRLMRARELPIWGRSSSLRFSHGKKVPVRSKR